MGLNRNLVIAVAFPEDTVGYWRDLLSEPAELEYTVKLNACSSTGQLINSEPDIIVGQPLSFVLDYLQTRPEKLRWLHVMSTGVERIVDRIGPEPGFAITNITGLNREAMREFTLAMMLHFAKRLDHWNGLKAARSWRPERLQLISGASLLVVGAGNIGTAVAEVCKALGMEVVGLSRTARPKPPYDQVLSLDQILNAAARADYVLASLPLTKQSKGIFNREFFASVKPGSIFINVSRGALVDEPALLDALEQGRLAGAALDAFEIEPLPAQSKLWELPNVFISPHVAGRFPNNHQLGRDHFLRNLQRFAGNEPLHSQIDLARGY